MKNNYIALLEHDKTTGKYGVVVPDFAVFTTVGDSFEDAIQNAVEGLASHIEVMRDLNEEIPSPRTFEQIKSEWDGWTDWVKNVPDYITAIIPAIPGFGTQRVFVTMDSRLVAKIDRVTKNRSAFLSSAAQYMLDHEHDKKRMAA